MKKNLIVIIIAVLMPVLMSAQAQVNTKKVKIADFPEKITKVVMTENMFYDSSLRDEIAARWRVSPYEFCTLEEFETLKTDENYYFLLTTKGQFKRETEPGLMFLTLVKGGRKAENGIDDMLEVLSLPLASAEDPSGRELVFLPAFIDIIQSYTLDAIAKDLNAYGGLGNYTMNLPEAKGKDVVFSDGDLNAAVADALLSGYFAEGTTLHITDEETADGYLYEARPNTLVSYVAAPSDPVNGSYSYNMLIDTESHKIYYFRKHRISKKFGAGFLPEDIKRIATHIRTR